MKRLLVAILFTLTIAGGCASSGATTSNDDPCGKEWTGNEQTDGQLLKDCMDAEYPDFKW